MFSQSRVAVFNANGVVGKVLIEILEGRNLPGSNLVPLATGADIGETISFSGKELPILDGAEVAFSDLKIVFFPEVFEESAVYAERAAAEGCIVIGSFDAIGWGAGVPMVVSEVNPEMIEGWRSRGMIASPNSAAVPILTALKPIHDAVGVGRVNVVTFEPVSSAGKEAIDELASQVKAVFTMNAVHPEVFPKQIAFNVIPAVGEKEDNGYTSDENQIALHIQRVLGTEDIAVNVTSVHVPVFYGISAAIHLETRAKLTVDDAKNLLENAPGIVVYDESESGGYPTPFTEGADNDPVFIGRMREDYTSQTGLAFWLVADNVRKGVALNCVQIAEILLEKDLS